MKIITRLFILWFLLQTQLNQAQTALCPSTATSFCCEYVQSVTFNGVFFQGNTGFTGPGYYDYTNVPMPILQAGTSVPLSVVVVTNGAYQQYVKFWIDFNNNGNLEDPGELVFDQTQLINATTYTFTGNIAVPPTAFNGPVRMRLIMVYANVPQLCGEYAYGNTFDFGTSLQGGVDPLQLTVNTTGSGNVVSNPTGINTATGLNFANFGQNTNVTLTATPIAPQVFTGWSGAASGTTNPLTVTMDQAKTITANFASNTPPTVTSLAHSNLTSASVTLSANVTSAGSAPITSRGFYYGTTNNPTTNLTTVSGTTGTMTANISGLQPNTTYYYRAFATNSVGTTFTTSGTFFTPNSPPTITSISNQVICSNTPTNSLDFVIADDITAASNLTLTATSSNNTLIPNGNIIFGGSGANRTVTVTPANNQSGTATITVTVTDEFNASTNTVFTVNVLAYPSVSYTQSPYLLYSGNSVGTITPTNTGGTGTSWTITPALPAGLSFNTSTGAITGIPTDGFNEATFQVTASNGQCTGNTTNIVLKALTCNVFDSSDFTLRGNAVVSGTQITLTPAEIVQFGALWGKDRMKLSEDFRIKSQLYFGNSDAGADGLAFVIQTLSSNQGSGGGGLGYAGINPSLAVEFDTYFNPPGDPFSTDHMAIMLNGDTSNHANFVSAIDLGNIEDDAWHDFEAHWTASTNNLKIYYDGVLRFNTTIDMVNNIFSGNENAYFGFTAATGGSVNVQAVRNLESCYTSIVNQAPTVTSISNQTNCLNQATPAIAFTIGDDTSPANEIQVSGTSTNTTLVPNGNILFGGSGANRTVTVTPITGQFGTTTITISVTDLDGATTTTSFNITFDDTLSPTVVVQNITVQLDGSGNVTILPSQVNNGSTDNCSIANVTVSPSTFNGTNLGDNTVTLTVTDERGNVSTQTATVTVEDVTPPTLVTTNSPNDPAIDNYTCGATYNFVAGPSSCVALVSIARPVWTDNVGVTSTTQTASNGVFLSNLGDIVFGNFPVGTTVVTFTASDSSGNITTCTLTIVVTDTQNPTITGCPNNIVTTNTTGTCERLVNLFIPTAGDNCSVASVTYATTGATTLSGNEFPNALVFNVGITTLVYTVTDASGNQTTCTYTVTVNDIDAPVITCPVSDQNLVADAGFCSYTHNSNAWNATSTDNCSSVVTYVLTGATTGSGSTLNGVAFNVGTTTVTWTATDGGGNTDTCSFDVVVADTQDPVISNTPSNIVVNNDATICGAVVSWTAPTAADNCAVASLVTTHPIGSTFPVGTTTVTYTATDINGNDSTSSFTVTVNDTEDPVISNTPTNITINNDLGNCSAVVTWTAPTAADNCAVANFVSTHNSGDTFPVGTTTVTYTATDIYGNDSTSSFTITVNDTEDPVISGTPGNITTNNDLGNCSAVVTWTLPTAADNCAVDTFVSTHNSGDTFPVGTTTVTYTATDIYGNDSTSSFTVTVNDTEDPVISNTPTNITVNNDLGNCSAVVTWTLPTAADNCAVDTFVSTHNSGDTFPVGTTTVTYTATDIYGNDSTSSFTVTVNDTEDPIISGTPSNITTNNDANECGAVVTWTAPTATDNCGFAGGEVIQNGSFESGLTSWTAIDNPSPLVAWSASPAISSGFFGPIAPTNGTLLAGNGFDGNAGTAIIYQDVAVPSSGGTLTWDDHLDYDLQNYCSGCSNRIYEVQIRDLSDNVLATAKSVTALAGTVVDGSWMSNSFNMSAFAGQTVRIAFVQNIPENFTGPAQFGLDNVSLSGSTSIVQTDSSGLSSGDLFPVGTTTIEYTSTDIHGNDATTSFTITVNDTEDPVISGTPANITVNNDLGNCSAVVTWTAPTAADNCAVDTFVSTHNSGDTFPVGTTTVTYTATDIYGNDSTSSFTVTVNDTEDPVISGTPANITVNNDLGNCSAVVTWTAPTAADNCAVDTFVSTHNPGDIFPVGTTTVTYTATDIYGNDSTSSFTVTVNDTEDPVISNTPTNITVNNDLGNCSAVVTWTAPTAADNCAVDTFVSTHNPGDTFPVGTTTVTYTATDIYGNDSTSSFTVTVNDTEDPVISGTPSNITVNNDLGNCSAVVTWTAPTAADNCAVASLVTSHPIGSTFPVGTTTVTYTATDIHGNDSTSSFTVTVNDTEDPVISGTPGNITINNDLGNCSALVTWTLPTAADNCAVDTFVSTHNSGDIFPVGTTTVIYTATDIYGNVSSTEFDVIVQDLEAPVVTCISDTIVSTDLDVCTYTIPNTSWDVVATDNCTIQTISYVLSGATTASGNNSIQGLVLNLGTTTITWTVVDIYGNDSVCSYDIEVEDNQAPSVTSTVVAAQPDLNGYACGDTFTFSTQPTNCFVTKTIAKPTWFDNCDQNLTLAFSADNGVVLSNIGDLVLGNFPLGTTTVTFSATDFSGNTTTCEIMIEVEDQVSPTLANCPTDMVVSAGSSCNNFVNLIVPFASDNCTIATITYALTGATTASGNGFITGYTFNLGITTVTYEVVDLAGNVTTCSFTVEVEDQTAPVITTQDLTTTITQGCSMTMALNTTATDDCGSVTLVGVRSDNLPLNDPFAIGVTTITWTATDGSGNVTTVIQTVTIIDNTLPVVTAPADVTVNVSPNSCIAFGINIGQPVVSDNCGTPTVTSNAPAFFAVGTTVVTWTVTDSYGNTVTVTQNVTVVDNLLPIVSVPGNITVNANQNCMATNVAIGQATAQDNCGVLSITNNAPNVYPLGVTNITWTVTDVNGNVVTAVQTVTVIDATAPSITAPSNITLNANANCVANNVNIGFPVTSDNCSNVTITNNAPTAFPVGVTMITWTATDAAGNVSTATQMVTVLDVIAPVATAPANVTANADANSCFATNVNLGTPVATDNCTANLTITNNAPAQFAVGTTTVVWTITDASGNSVTVSQLVTVTDNQMPTIVAPANVVVDANSGCSAFNVSLGQATAQDNCGVASITNNAPVVFALGVTTITWTVTDVNGNVTTATQTVTVVDTTAPSLVAPANVTATAGANCQATVVLGNPITSDNCGSVTVTNNAPSTFPVGVTTVTWTATDAAGNVSTATQTVTVTDVTAPVATVPANVSVNADANSCVATNVVLGTPVATDNCTANLTITNNAPAQFAIGTTTVVWTIVDASGNSVTVTQTVTVTDNQAPTIVAPANVTANANNSCEASNVNLGTATAADNCGTVTLTNNAPAVFPLGATTVTWTATDASGNTTTATQVVTVVDATAPSLMVSNAIQVNADANSCFATNVNLGNFIALDNCTTVTVTNNAPASYPTGLTVVTWTATDAAGNVTTATQNVLVIDTTAPVVTPPANVSVSTDTTGCSATNVNLGNPIATDNCGIASITNDAPAQFPVGTTTVFWTATDNFGNTTTVSQTVTVTDLVAPVAQTQNITVNLSAQGTASITAMQVNNASTDNCGIASMSVSPSSFTCANLGANTVTLTVVDQSGNTSTATAVVTIADNLAPVAIANNVTVALNEQGQASITAAQVNNGSTDNCGVANISVSPTTFDCSNLGNNTVVLTVTDASGNVSTTNANVLVVDEIAPVAITKDITLNVTFEQPVTISPEDVNDGSFDNCSITSMSLSKDTFDCGDYGENIVELTVVDQSGNSSSMSLVVTVNRCTVRVSDVITPNGDGINDTWMVYNIEQYPANQVYVYNRWGDQVFTSKGYMNTWDGSYKNRGQKLPEAASYYYQIDLDGDGVIDQDGWLYITR